MKNIMPPRAWTIYLSCLEKPMSLKQIADENGYASQSMFSHRYEEIPIIQWLLNKQLVEFHSKKGKETFWKSKKSDWLMSEITEQKKELSRIQSMIRSSD